MHIWNQKCSVDFFVTSQTTVHISFVMCYASYFEYHWIVIYLVFGGWMHLSLHRQVWEPRSPLATDTLLFLPGFTNTSAFNPIATEIIPVTQSEKKKNTIELTLSKKLIQKHRIQYSNLNPARAIRWVVKHRVLRWRWQSNYVKRFKLSTKLGSRFLSSDATFLRVSRQSFFPGEKHVSLRINFALNDLHLQQSSRCSSWSSSAGAGRFDTAFTKELHYGRIKSSASASTFLNTRTMIALRHEIMCGINFVSHSLVLWYVFFESFFN